MRIRNILVVLVITMILGGCGVISAFKNQDEAQEFVLSYMEKKYEESFIIVDEGHYDNYGPIFGDSYFCMVAPEENPEKVMNVFTRHYGKIQDDGAVYYYKDNVEKEVKDALKDIKNMQIQQMALVMPLTTIKWNENDDLEKYLLESGAYVEITFGCDTGLTSEEYAALINDVLKIIYKLKVNTEISVKAGESYIFFENITVIGDNLTEPFSMEQLEKKVRSMIG